MLRDNSYKYKYKFNEYDVKFCYETARHIPAPEADTEKNAYHASFAADLIDCYVKQTCRTCVESQSSYTNTDVMMTS